LRFSSTFLELKCRSGISRDFGEPNGGGGLFIDDGGRLPHPPAPDAAFVKAPLRIAGLFCFMDSAIGHPAATSNRRGGFASGDAGCGPSLTFCSGRSQEALVMVVA
jgi:hypothetical protein